MSDEQTLAVYDDRVEDYISLTKRDEIDPDLVRFMKALKKGAFVLDLGCGPGMASVILRENGFRPDPVDASNGMVSVANETHELGARVATFDDIKGREIYDGVWANFSLLHAARKTMARHLTDIHGALKPGGMFHIGMKTGEGEERDRIGRFYTYYREDELGDLLEKAGFTLVDTSHGDDDVGLSGDVSSWITILAVK